MIVAPWKRWSRGRASGQRSRWSVLFTNARALGLALAVVAVSVGCGAREQIVYVDPVRPGGYSPITRSSSPRVHQDGEHEIEPDVQIGPAVEAGSAHYTPFASSGGRLVHAGGSHTAVPPVTIAGQLPPGAPASASDASASHGAAPSAGSHAATAPTSTSHGPTAPAQAGPAAAAPSSPGSQGAAAAASAPGARAPAGAPASGSPVTVASSAGSQGVPAPPSGSSGPAASSAAVSGPATAPANGALGPTAPAADAHGPAVNVPAPGAATVPQPASSPIPADRLALGPGLGAVPGTPTPNTALDMDEEKTEGQATITGKIESMAGSLLTIQTPSGSQEVRLADRARVERDTMGTTADLKPGQFVGVVHTPSGPADAVRLYATSPSMPRPGIAPVVGSRTGQVTTFGSIVKVEFGGLLLNTGSQTTSVTLPSGVPIMRPVGQGPSDLAVGTQVVATGPIESDGSLVATAVRVTGESRNPTPVARSSR